MKRIIIKKLRSLSFRIFRDLFNQDIEFARNMVSVFSTADYIEKNMSDIPSVDSIFKVHDVAIEHIKIQNGAVLEFGVFSGGTINYLAKKLPDSKLFGFDSFEGLPAFWRDGFQKGHFSMGELPKVERNVMLIKGWFNETLPVFSIDDKIAYLHIDCDLYSSTKIIFENLKDKICEGTVIVFDEYFNYPGWLVGEFKAFKEFIEKTGKEYRYISYNRKHEQVALIITKG